MTTEASPSAPPDGTLTVDPDPDGVLRVRGEIDLASVPRLEQAIAAVDPGAGPVVLDLSEVTFFDCSGLRVFSDFANRSAESSLVLRSPSTFVERVIRLVGFDPHPGIVLQFGGTTGDRPEVSSDRVFAVLRSTRWRLAELNRSYVLASDSVDRLRYLRSMLRWNVEMVRGHRHDRAGGHPAVTGSDSAGLAGGGV